MGTQHTRLHNMYSHIILLCFALAQLTSSQAQILTEGGTCWDGDHNGTCVALYRCPSAANYYLYVSTAMWTRAMYAYKLLDNTGEAGNTKAIEGLSEPVECTRGGAEPLVCCTDCVLDDKQKLKNKVVMVNGVKYGRKGPKAWTKCLQYFRELPYPCRGVSGDVFSQRWDEKRQCSVFLQQSYGVGGVAAERGQFPHMALLGYGAEPQSAQWLCGGSVISERFILTAAHCASTPTLGRVRFAALGVLLRREVGDYWSTYEVARVLAHPQYRPPHKYHDIALLQTTTEINFSKSLLPACLDFSEASAEWGKAPGWGRLGPRGRLAENLMVMELQQFNESSCAVQYPPHRLLRRGLDAATQMCYGRRDRLVDTCEGDSGGPLQRSDGDCVHYVFGVTSYGQQCGALGGAGVYTRVAHYVPWIEGVVWPDY